MSIEHRLIRGLLASALTAFAIGVSYWLENVNPTFEADSNEIAIVSHNMIADFASARITTPCTSSER